MNHLDKLESRTFLSAAPATAEYDYLSSLRPTASTNGFGPFERNTSNGENLAGDGAAMMIGGRLYRKGLGVHADAELHYKLGGKYRSFISDVGIDDEIGDGGSVVFQVFADGQKMFDSGVMTGASITRRINIDVSGMNELVLVASSAGDGNTDDHADFGGARLVKPFGEAPVVASIANVSLDQARQFLSAAGSFTDASGNALVGTIDWGDGRARQYLTLTDDNTFDLGHWYPIGPDSTYTATIRISNGGAVGIGTFQVSVEDLPPSNVGLAGQTNQDGSFNAFAGLSFNAGGVFSDPGAFGGETYTATIDYGDGSPIADAPVDGRFFDVQHVYRRAGTYTVTTTVIDAGGESGVGMNTVVVTTPIYSYLSDMQPTTQSGAARNDRSAAGSRINVSGSLYTKGIGVIADSELVYNLGGKHRTLIADVGVDDEVDGVGSAMQFLVYADGNLVFDSGTMTSNSGAKRMNVDVSGVSELRLVVAHAGDRASSADHGDWARIRLV